MGSDSISRDDASEFLAREAFLLDERRFEEWLGLFTEDGLYWIPGDDPEGDPAHQVSIVYDDAARRRARVERLQHRSNWRDDPEGRLVHSVTNVLVDPATSNGDVPVHSSQIVCHARRGDSIWLAARCVHMLRLTDDGWRISSKKVGLAQADQYFPPGSIVLL